VASEMRHLSATSARLLACHASPRTMSLTSPVAISSQTSLLSRPPLLTIQPTLQRPFGVQVSRAACKGSGSAKQPGLPTQTRASAFAIAAAIISSVNSTSATALPTNSGAKRPDPDLRRHQPDQRPRERFVERSGIERLLLR
jgi:hypothetical protein